MLLEGKETGKLVEELCPGASKAQSVRDAPVHNSETSLPPMNDFCVVSQDLGHFSKKLHGFPIFVLCSGKHVHFQECKYTDRAGMGQKVVSRRQGMQMRGKIKMCPTADRREIPFGTFSKLGNISTGVTFKFHGL